MIRLFTYLFCSIIAAGCVSKSTQESHDDFQSWLNKNRIKPHERLIDFNYEVVSESDIPRNQIRKTLIGDTLVVSFASTQPVGCLLIGDVEILKNQIELKFGQACSPHQDGIVNEEANLLFTYKIIHGEDLIDKNLKISGLTKMIK